MEIKERDVDLASVSIPGSVESIGIYAFNGCESLENLTLSEGLKTIEGGAFMGCPITSLVIPNSVTTINTYVYSTTYSTYYDGAFENCEKLTSVTIGDRLTGIEREAFRACSALTAVTIGARMQTIGEYAFAYCTSLKEIDMGGTTVISNYCFYGCTSLENVTVGAYVTKIGDYAFSNCINLASVNIPGSVESIGIYAFNGCESLENLTLNEGLRTIEGGAFMGCPITSLVIPNSVTTINTYVYSSTYSTYYDGASLPPRQECL